MPSDTRTTVARTGEREMVVSRVFDAPRDLVWKAWTDPEALKQWWGPRAWPTTYCTIDLRVGGAWHYRMTGPDGAESWGKGIYQEITPPERLVYIDVFSDAEGNTNESMPTLEVTVEFHDRDGKTEVVSTSQTATKEQLDALLGMGVVEGVSETWDRLEEYLARA